jgi:hypothetical protein
MDRQGYIEIHIVGSEGNNALTPENFDIKEIKAVLDGVEDLLYPNNKKDRPDISYTIESGSVKNIFRTSMQAVITFSAVMTMVNTSKSLDGLELPTARAIEKIQGIARKSDYIFEFKTSNSSESILTISPETNYQRTADLWIDAEFYFYGTLTNAGGKDKSNIHLDTKDVGTLIISTEKDFLKEKETNLLYREFGVRVRGKQNFETGEIDRNDLQLVDLIDYTPKYDDLYINSLISKVGDKFKEIDVDAWIAEIRGNNE